MNYYEHHLGDYVRDTAHLSMLEDCAYRRLLDAYYVREKPLPAEINECCKLARASARAERAAVSYVLKEFFTLSDDGYHQKRCDETIAKFHDKQDKARASGLASAAAKAQRRANERSTDVERTLQRTLNEPPTPNLQSPVTSNQEEALRASESAPPSPGVKPTPEAEMAIALRDLGVAVTSDDKTLCKLVADGFTAQQACEAVGIARIRKPWPERIPINYLDPILRQPKKPPKSLEERITWRPDSDENGPCINPTLQRSAS